VCIHRSESVLAYTAGKALVRPINRSRNSIFFYTYKKGLIIHIRIVEGVI
jgi:hypothetical protein